MSELGVEIKREVGQVRSLIEHKTNRCSSALFYLTKHFVFGFHGHKISEDVKKLITEYYVGYVARLISGVEPFILTYV